MPPIISDAMLESLEQTGKDLIDDCDHFMNDPDLFRRSPRHRPTTTAASPFPYHTSPPPHHSDYHYPARQPKRLRPGSPSLDTSYTHPNIHHPGDSINSSELESSDGAVNYARHINTTDLSQELANLSFGTLTMGSMPLSPNTPRRFPLHPAAVVDRHQNGGMRRPSTSASSLNHSSAHRSVRGGGPSGSLSMDDEMSPLDFEINEEPDFLLRSHPGSDGYGDSEDMPNPISMMTPSAKTHPDHAQWTPSAADISFQPSRVFPKDMWKSALTTPQSQPPPPGSHRYGLDLDHLQRGDDYNENENEANSNVDDGDHISDEDSHFNPHPHDDSDEGEHATGAGTLYTSEMLQGMFGPPTTRNGLDRLSAELNQAIQRDPVQLSLHQTGIASQPPSAASSRSSSPSFAVDSASVYSTPMSYPELGHHTQRPHHQQQQQHQHHHTNQRNPISPPRDSPAKPSLTNHFNQFQGQFDQPQPQPQLQHLSQPPLRKAVSEFILDHSPPRHDDRSSDHSVSSWAAETNPHPSTSRFPVETSTRITESDLITDSFRSKSRPGSVSPASFVHRSYGDGPSSLTEPSSQWGLDYIGPNTATSSLARMASNRAPEPNHSVASSSSSSSLSRSPALPPPTTAQSRRSPPPPPPSSLSSSSTTTTHLTKPNYPNLPFMSTPKPPREPMLLNNSPSPSIPSLNHGYPGATGHSSVALSPVVGHNRLTQAMFGTSHVDLEEEAIRPAGNSKSPDMHRPASSSGAAASPQTPRRPIPSAESANPETGRFLSSTISPSLSQRPVEDSGYHYLPSPRRTTPIAPPSLAPMSDDRMAPLQSISPGGPRVQRARFQLDRSGMTSPRGLLLGHRPKPPTTPHPLHKSNFLSSGSFSSVTSSAALASIDPNGVMEAGGRPGDKATGPNYPTSSTNALTNSLPRRPSTLSNDLTAPPRPSESTLHSSSTTREDTHHIPSHLSDFSIADDITISTEAAAGEEESFDFMSKPTEHGGSAHQRSYSVFSQKLLESRHSSQNSGDPTQASGSLESFLGSVAKQMVPSPSSKPATTQDISDAETVRSNRAAPAQARPPVGNYPAAQRGFVPNLALERSHSSPAQPVRSTSHLQPAPIRRHSEQDDDDHADNGGLLAGAHGHRHLSDPAARFEFNWTSTPQAHTNEPARVLQMRSTSGDISTNSSASQSKRASEVTVASPRQSAPSGEAPPSPAAILPQAVPIPLAADSSQTPLKADARRFNQTPLSIVSSSFRLPDIYEVDHLATPRFNHQDGNYYLNGSTPQPGMHSAGSQSELRRGPMKNPRLYGSELSIRTSMRSSLADPPSEVDPKSPRPPLSTVPAPALTSSFPHYPHGQSATKETPLLQSMARKSHLTRGSAVPQHKPLASVPQELQGEAMVRALMYLQNKLYNLESENTSLEQTIRELQRQLGEMRKPGTVATSTTPQPTITLATQTSMLGTPAPKRKTPIMSSTPKTTITPTHSSTPGSARKLEMTGRQSDNSAHSVNQAEDSNPLANSDDPSNLTWYFPDEPLGPPQTSAANNEVDAIQRALMAAFQQKEDITRQIDSLTHYSQQFGALLQQYGEQTESQKLNGNQVGDDGREVADLPDLTASLDIPNQASDAYEPMDQHPEHDSPRGGRGKPLANHLQQDRFVVRNFGTSPRPTPPRPRGVDQQASPMASGLLRRSETAPLPSAAFYSSITSPPLPPLSSQPRLPTATSAGSPTGRGSVGSSYDEMQREERLMALETIEMYRFELQRLVQETERVRQMDVEAAGTTTTTPEEGEKDRKSRRKEPKHPSSHRRTADKMSRRKHKRQPDGLPALEETGEAYDSDALSEALSRVDLDSPGSSFMTEGLSQLDPLPLSLARSISLAGGRHPPATKNRERVPGLNSPHPHTRAPLEQRLRPTTAAQSPDPAKPLAKQRLDGSPPPSASGQRDDSGAFCRPHSAQPDAHPSQRPVSYNDGYENEPLSPPSSTSTRKKRGAATREMATQVRPSLWDNGRDPSDGPTGFSNTHRDTAPPSEWDAASVRTTPKSSAQAHPARPANPEPPTSTGSRPTSSRTRFDLAPPPFHGNVDDGDNGNDTFSQLHQPAVETPFHGLSPVTQNRPLSPSPQQAQRHPFDHGASDHHVPPPLDRSQSFTAPRSARRSPPVRLTPVSVRMENRTEANPPPQASAQEMAALRKLQRAKSSSRASPAQQPHIPPVSREVGNTHGWEDSYVSEPSELRDSITVLDQHYSPKQPNSKMASSPRVTARHPVSTQTHTHDHGHCQGQSHEHSRAHSRQPPAFVTGPGLHDASPSMSANYQQLLALLQTQPRDRCPLCHAGVATAAANPRTNSAEPSEPPEWKVWEARQPHGSSPMAVHHQAGCPWTEIRQLLRTIQNSNSAQAHRSCSHHSPPSLDADPLPYSLEQLHSGPDVIPLTTTGGAAPSITCHHIDTLITEVEQEFVQLKTKYQTLVHEYEQLDPSLDTAFATSHRQPQYPHVKDTPKLRARRAVGKQLKELISLIDIKSLQLSALYDIRQSAAQLPSPHNLMAAPHPPPVSRSKSSSRRVSPPSLGGAAATAPFANHQYVLNGSHGLPRSGGGGCSACPGAGSNTLANPTFASRAKAHDRANAAGTIKSRRPTPAHTHGNTATATVLSAASSTHPHPAHTTDLHQRPITRQTKQAKNYALLKGMQWIQQALES
ncbi:hypothetical protein H4R33_001626 [Dimargaris cristalligena]|nr:hypothetical protein H4R33_001626 [Dimargaris cristalligena]